MQGVSMTEDRRLLRAYVTEGCRPALDELIRRHLALVYSSALRQVRDPHLAEDVTQAVFFILTMKAQTIRKGVAVGGWLLAVTRYTAINTMKKHATQKKHERLAARSEARVEAEDEWEQIAPWLDQELNRLPVIDRSAVVLRFFLHRSFAETGAELGISPEAARKRVARALRRLRAALIRRGGACSVGGLEMAIAARAVHLVPATLLADAIRATTNLPSQCISIVKGAMKMLARNESKWGVAIAACLVLVLACSAVIAVTSGNPQTPNAGAPSVSSAGTGAATRPVIGQVFSVMIRQSTSGHADYVLRTVQSFDGMLCNVNEDGTREVIDLRTYERVVFNDDAKTAMIYAGTTDPRTTKPSPPLAARYLEMVQKGARDLGPDRVEGRATEKYFYRESGMTFSNVSQLPTSNTIWIDTVTGQPVRVTTAASYGNLKMSGLYYDFEVDPKLPPGFLSLDPPPGFKLITPPQGKNCCSIYPMYRRILYAMLLKSCAMR
jgi:RNA polymerase sigma factor (sigma-70 family)